MFIMRQLSKLRALKPSIYNKTFATISSQKIVDETAENDEKTTHFGFQTVKESEKAKKGYQTIYNILKK